MNTEKFYFGSNIKYLREQDKLSKTRMSEVIGCTPTEIGALERNAIPKPSYQIVEALALFFGVDMLQLVRSDLNGLERSIDRDLKRILLNTSGLHDQSEFLLRRLLSSTLDTLSETNHYSIRNRVFKRDAPSFSQNVIRKVR